MIKSDPKYQIHTFGCKVNTYDSGLMQKNLQAAGFTTAEKAQGQIHILNTCAVTAEATKEAVKTVRRIKAQDPFATVIVTGCAAQVDTGSFENLPGADLVVANSHKGLLPFLIDQHFKGELKEKVFKSNIFKKDDLEMGGGVEESHTRAFLKIQDGCNSFCSFCIIPYARGKSRSLPMKALADRINQLHSEGVQEVVLTGVHIGDYEDKVMSKIAGLDALIEYLLKNTQMPRFRLTSLEPIELSGKILELYASEERLCRHFHMSIQSANTDVLHQMKRKYTQADVVQSLQNIEKYLPGSFVGMDVIAGFPTETEEQFEDTYQVLAELPWTRLHVFPYSERPGTKAAAMDVRVDVGVRRARAKKLRELSLHRYQSQALKQFGLKKKVLVLNNEARGAQGLSRDYWPVRWDMTQDWKLKSGQEIEVEISQYEQNEKWQDGVLLGRLGSTL